MAHTIPPVTLNITLEGDICRYAVQQMETHIRSTYDHILECVKNSEFEEARASRKYLRSYWKELLPRNHGAINYWAYALSMVIKKFYEKQYETLPNYCFRSVIAQVQNKIDAQWEYLESLEEDDWLEELYEEFHPDKVLSKIRIPSKTTPPGKE